MCGINGIYGLNDEVQSKTMIAKMNTALSHRGPDDEGIFAEHKIALGHRRLSIIDLSAAGHNPMFSNDKRYCIIHNGEIYNFREIKNELKDYDFKTSTDTEVVLAAYSQWGKDCLQKFNGMFAFAIWDTFKKELFIARDRLGIKPLYYYQKDKLLVFSSEIRALLSSDLLPKKLDKERLVDYLRYQTVHAPQTIIENVFMLMPGHYISVSENNGSASFDGVYTEQSQSTQDGSLTKDFEIKKYWDASEKINTTTDKKSYREVCADINELLTKAVERRLVADVPFGAFLSGGIDSSAIVGLMSKVATEKVKTFSVVFDEGEFSEAKYSRIVAKKFNTDHHEIELTPEDFLEELPSALKAMDHPSGDGPNSYVVSKATKNAGITMALSGLGGDELFAGYDIFKRSITLEKNTYITKIPKLFRKAGGNILKSIRKDVASEKISELLELENWNFENTYPLSRQTLLDSQIKKLLNQNFVKKNSVLEIVKFLTSKLKTSNTKPTKVSLAEISTYMQNVLLRDADQMSMAHALEVRVPFLDFKLVEYVLSVPDKYKISSTPKKLLIDSLGNLLPAEIVYRKKMGFTFPWEQWMKKELKSFCEERINSLSKRNHFNEEGVKKLWVDFLENDARITWSRLWHLIVLEEWMQKNGIDS